MGEVFLELVALPLGQRGIPGRGDAPAIPEDVAQDRPDVGGVGHHLREDVDHAVANGLEGRRPGIGVELQLGVRPVLENGVEVGQRGVGEPDGLGDRAETLLPLGESPWAMMRATASTCTRLIRRSWAMRENSFPGCPARVGA